MVSIPRALPVEPAAESVNVDCIVAPDTLPVMPDEVNSHVNENVATEDTSPATEANAASLLDAIDVAWDEQEDGQEDEHTAEPADAKDEPSAPLAELPLTEREPWVLPADYVPSPFAIPRDQHGVSRKHISKNALSVLYRLHESGFRALLVGGGVRDVLLGRSPKDFDIATDATPEQVRRLFRNCRLIGRRFRLAHVLFGRDVVEVATFRASGEDEPGRKADESGRLLRDNVYGTIEDDVVRRDFTVNALYYDIADFSVLDHVGGMQDLRDGVLRLLGDPETRYREDPVRMLRAARFAAKLGFKLHEDTEKPIAELSSLLAGIPPARLIDECVKLFHTGHGAASLHELVRLDLLRWLLPPLHEAMSQVEDDGAAWAFLYAALSNTDRRVADGLPLSTAFLFAALLWPVVVMQAQAHAHAGQPEAVLLQQAGDEVLYQIQPHIAIPRHLQLLIREIWEMQVRFVVHQGRGVASLHGHPRFRAAYDFLLLRTQVGEPQALEDAAWWQAFVETGAEDALGLGGGDKGRSKRRRSSRRRKGAESAAGETETLDESDLDGAHDDATNDMEAEASDVNQVEISEAEAVAMDAAETTVTAEQAMAEAVEALGDEPMASMMDSGAEVSQVERVEEQAVVEPEPEPEQHKPTEPVESALLDASTQDADVPAENASAEEALAERAATEPLITETAHDAHEPVPPKA
ncbi:MAG: polynucleotide adenylyltransferase PcnB [Halothiobacillaceae bacterium]